MCERLQRLRIAGSGLSLFALACLTTLPLQAQDAKVPRTRTFSGLLTPAFPYSRPEEVGLSGEKLNEIGDEITEWIAGDWHFDGELVGAELLVVKNGKAVFHEAYGWSDREARVPMRRNSIFSIKSMSKPFTATAVLMLADDGKLSLDDPVGRYLHLRLGKAGAEADLRYHLVPLGDDRFTLGRYGDGRLEGVDTIHGVRFEMEDGVPDALKVLEKDRVMIVVRPDG